MNINPKDETFNYIIKLTLSDLNYKYPGLKKNHIFYVIRALFKIYAKIIRTINIKDVVNYEFTRLVIPGLCSINFKSEWGITKTIGYRNDAMTHEIYRLLMFLRKHNIAKIYSSLTGIIFYDYYRNEIIKIRTNKMYNKYSYVYEMIIYCIEKKYITIDDFIKEFPNIYTLEELQSLLPVDKRDIRPKHGISIIATLRDRELIFNDISDFAAYLEKIYNYQYVDAIKNIKKILSGKRNSIKHWTIKRF